MIEMHTDKLILRPLVQEDWRDLQKIAGTDAVAYMTSSISSPWSDYDAQEWVRLRVSDKAIPKTLIVEVQNKTVGLVGIGGKPTSLMYLIEKEYWGQGLASEAVHRTLSYAFKHSDTAEIIADVFHDNPASVRVLEKNGFICVGQGVDTSLARVEPAPLFLYRLTRTQFEGLNQ